MSTEYSKAAGLKQCSCPKSPHTVAISTYVVCEMSIKERRRLSSRATKSRHSTLSTRMQYCQHLTLAGALLQRMVLHLLPMRMRQTIPLQKHPQKMMGRLWQGSSRPLTDRSRRTLMAVLVYLMMKMVRAQVRQALVCLMRS